jgi:isoeugenol monooxygenase
MDGGPRWAWDPDLTTHLGVVPRNRPIDELVYFEGPALFSFHTLNSWTEGNRVHIDLCVSERAPFPDKHGQMFTPAQVQFQLTRWTCDLDRPGSDFEQRVLLEGLPVDFPEIDQRFATVPHRHAFLAARDTTRPVNPDIAVGVWFNTLVHLDQITGETERWYVGDDANLQEPVFIPRSDEAPEGDGFLVALVNRLPQAHTELVVVDTARFTDGPVATVHVPMHVRPTFHGLWVSSEELGRVPDLDAARP